MDPILGQICMVGFNFAPRGWALCNGQLLSISQNSALFSLLGTTYGGDGVQTFALPNLQGRVPIHMGTLPSGNNYNIGELAGTETVTLNTNQIPTHTHTLAVSNAVGGLGAPDGNYIGKTGRDGFSKTANATMNPGAIAPNGGSQPHDNRQPYLVVNFIIATEGIFPSR